MSIYLDHTATSPPKPAVVCRQMNEVTRRIGANPRSFDTKLAHKTNQILTESHGRVTELLGIAGAKRVIFTGSAIRSINLGLKGLLSQGDSVPFWPEQSKLVWGVSTIPKTCKRLPRRFRKFPG